MRGFTLIELLVVIAIIGILASVVMASLGSSRDKADVSKIASELRSVEKAFQLLMTHEGATSWWRDNAFTGSGNPTITTLVSDQTRLGLFLKRSPEPPVGASYYYDNDGDTATCGGTATRGVNLYTDDGVSADILSALDELFDDGDGSLCGKINWGSSNELLYRLSPSQNQ